MLSTQAQSRGGWSPEETHTLWQEVRNVSASGEPLRAAFDRTANQTGRQPNSIRNYYYQSLKSHQAPEELCAIRTQPFVPFSAPEVDWLLREILTDRARGVSVRACVQRLGEGDRAKALRYQNKYRSVLKSHPDRIRETIALLAREGIHCPDPYDTPRMRRKRRELEDSARLPMAREEGEAEGLANLIRALREAIGQERGEEMRHREQMDRMNVRCDLLRLELARRDERLLEMQQQEQQMRAALKRAAGLMEVCREFLGVEDITPAGGQQEVRERMSREILSLENALS